MEDFGELFPHYAETTVANYWWKDLEMTREPQAILVLFQDVSSRIIASRIAQSRARIMLR